MSIISLSIKRASSKSVQDLNHHNSLHVALCSGADLYPLHLQESGHLKSLFPDEQFAIQFHTEEHVLPTLCLDAEAVLPLVQKVIILGEDSTGAMLMWR